MFNNDNRPAADIAVAKEAKFATSETQHMCDTPLAANARQLPGKVAF
jgi:hypothetical protein